MEFVTANLVGVLNQLLSKKIGYLMDGSAGKVVPITTEVKNINHLDCSGFVQYVIYHSTSKNTLLRQGSSNQRRDVRNDASHTKADYATTAKLQDDIVRIGFRDAEYEIELGEDGKPKLGANGKPKVARKGTSKGPGTGAAKKTKVGHVWLVINGKTYESTSAINRSQGPKSLLWSKRTKDEDHFYTLGAAPGFAFRQGVASMKNKCY